VDWVLTDLRGQVAGGGPPLGFEMALLEEYSATSPSCAYRRSAMCCA
jgi:hypothetical protein